MALNVDVLVCGGGMSDMACAAFAAQAGAKVLVVEKQLSLEVLLITRRGCCKCL